MGRRTEARELVNAPVGKYYRAFIARLTANRPADTL